MLTPNGERVLSGLGFDLARARANEMTCWELLDGATLETIARTNLSNAREIYGAPLHTVHRADLHQELFRLASISQWSKGSGRLELELGARIVAAHAEGFVELDDGTRHHVDLIVAADGLHSVVRHVVLGEEHQAQSTPSGMSAFRFLIPTSLLKDDPQF